MTEAMSATAIDSAQNLAGKSIFLEMGARLGVIELLMQSEPFDAEQVVRISGAKRHFVDAYLAALCKLGLANQGPRPDSYTGTDALPVTVNNCGYLLWALQSCAPLIEHPVQFANDLPGSIATYVRNGEHVARTSKWMGATDFYPHAEKEILKANPKKIIDFGSGTCGLLIRLLEQLPQATGIGIDLSAGACQKAREIIEGKGLSHRIQVIHAPVESLIDDPALLKDVDVIHAGFVFHDLNPTQSQVLPSLLTAIKTASPRAKLVIADAIPDDEPWENNAYSLAFTFLHTHFMDRKFPSADGWKRLLEQAGFMDVTLSKPGLSGSRLIVGH
jgi:Methyltransferase domain